jgi:hypothetical protein
MGRRVHILGKRGQWVAEVEGRLLAVLHNSHWTPPAAYRAPIRPQDLGGAKLRGLLDALQRQPLAVMQRDKGPNLDRDGYVGVFAFSGLAVTDEAITLTIDGRYADPA